MKDITPLEKQLLELFRLGDDVVVVGREGPAAGCYGWLGTIISVNGSDIGVRICTTHIVVRPSDIRLAPWELSDVENFGSLPTINEAAALA